ncbi:Splicing factor RNPS1, SR protein superfamily [Phaffia rhodozyma]|uniref:Splicing factor RNPS1, SR protein superfamily n=1 Tax=Phaffia rhodozyma TaxID=264483 RepID=A0A0F7SGP0_PHARH|nr:Splicing factor RNPS1, SR protein superfamily [Phaffia rhodozyma]
MSDHENNEGVHADDEAAAELEAMKQRVKEMEAEAAKLRELQAEVEREEASSAGGRAGSSTPAGIDAALEGGEPMEEDKEDVDGRSIYVGNVDYGATPEEIQGHFAACGQINRVTILCDKFTGHPKGYAYVEFAEPSFITSALVLDESPPRERTFRVSSEKEPEVGVEGEDVVSSEADTGSSSPGAEVIGAEAVDTKE